MLRPLKLAATLAAVIYAIGVYASSTDTGPTAITVNTFPLQLDARITSQSVKGYCAKFTIRNIGSASQQGWEVGFTLAGNTLKHLHHANVTVTGEHISVTPYPNSETITPNHHRQFELCTEGSHVPADFLQSVILTLGNLAPVISILSPTANAALQANTVVVSGTYNGPANTGITVNGVIAFTDGHRFYANDVPLLQGINTLEATATTPRGKSAVATLKVTSLGASSLQISASPSAGAPPHQTTFRYSLEGNPGIQHITMDFNGDGVTDFTTTQSSAPIQYTYTHSGVYLARMTLTDAQGFTHSASHAIQVLDIPAMNTMLRGVYTGMLAQLKARNTEGALTAVTAGVYEKYKDIFTHIKPQVVDQLGVLQDGAIGNSMAEYAVLRDTSAGQQAFLIYFIRSEDGVWRIDGM